MVWLGDNEIVDISPLSGLTSLTSLNLSNNRIADVKGLAGLDMPWRLYPSNNLITEVSPLARLDSPLLLWLDGNQIEEFPAIEGLRDDPSWRVPVSHETYEISCEHPHVDLPNNALRSLEGLEQTVNLREGHVVDSSGNPFDRGIPICNAMAITRLRARGITICL